MTKVNINNKISKKFYVIIILIVVCGIILMWWNNITTYSSIFKSNWGIEMYEPSKIQEIFYEKGRDPSYFKIDTYDEETMEKLKKLTYFKKMKKYEVINVLYDVYNNISSNSQLLLEKNFDSKLLENKENYYVDLKKEDGSFGLLILDVSNNLMYEMFVYF